MARVVSSPGRSGPLTTLNAVHTAYRIRKTAQDFPMSLELLSTSLPFHVDMVEFPDLTLASAVSIDEGSSVDVSIQQLTKDYARDRYLKKYVKSIPSHNFFSLVLLNSTKIG